MKLADKTKKELIDELEVSRKRVSMLEKQESDTRLALDNPGKRNNRSFPQLAHMHEGIVIIFDRKIEFINDIFASLFGVTPSEACSYNFDPMSLIAPESRRFIRKQYQEGCSDAYKAKQISYTGLCKDGSKIECETFLLFIPYKWGVAIQCTLHSVTASKQTDEALQRHYSDLPAVFMRHNRRPERQMICAE